MIFTVISALLLILWLIILWDENHEDKTIKSMRAEFDSYKEAIYLIESHVESARKKLG